jgi:hypothetical protein
MFITLSCQLPRLGPYVSFIDNAKVVKYFEICKHLNKLIALINTYDDL